MLLYLIKSYGVVKEVWTADVRNNWTVFVLMYYCLSHIFLFHIVWWIDTRPSITYISLPSLRRQGLGRVIPSPREQQHAGLAGVLTISRTGAVVKKRMFPPILPTQSTPKVQKKSVSTAYTMQFGLVIWLLVKLLCKVWHFSLAIYDKHGWNSMAWRSDSSRLYTHFKHKLMCKN